MKTSFEFVHKDSYSTALEVTKKFVNRAETRPILNYVLHSANGDMLATDSHHLIHIRNMHGFEKDYLINPHHYTVAKGEYPDTAKLTERTDKHKNMICLNQDQIKLWQQLFKSINQTLKVLKDRYKVITLSFPESSEEVIIELKNHGIKMNLPCTRINSEKHDRISFSAEFMRDALEAHFKLNSDNMNMWFAGAHRPFILDDDKQVKTLILPVRTY